MQSSVAGKGVWIGIKIPNRLGKMSVNPRGILLTHTVLYASEPKQLFPTLYYLFHRDPKLWPLGLTPKISEAFGGSSAVSLVKMRLLLLLARYVPNVANRSIWEQCRSIYWGPTDPPPQIWKNFKWPYLREGSSDPLHVWFYGGVFGVGGSNGANSDLTKFNRYVGENNARGVIRILDWSQSKVFLVHDIALTM